AIRTGAATADHDNFPVTLKNEIVPLGRLVAESRRDTAISAKTRVQRSVRVKASGDERERKVIMDHRSGGNDLAVTLESDPLDPIAACVERGGGLAARAETSVQLAIGVIAREPGMEDRIHSALSAHDDLTVPLNLYCES